ncbi:MAG TPA: thioesterase family protein [Polyangiales bacterium]|nr:thioesterase family protein [Polyangiales bacterium]
MTSFSELLARATTDASGSSLSVPDDWMQGRSVFGGLQVAFALQAMRAIVPDAPLRTLQASFVAPVSGTMRARTRILRQGKNATQVETRIGDDAADQAVVLAAFGTARSSIVARTFIQPEIEVPERVVEMPRDKNSALPQFTSHFHVRMLHGQPPFSGSTSWKSVLEISMDEESGFATEAHLVAIADFIPPIAMSHLTSPAPGSTLTWMLEPLVDRFEGVSLQGFRVDAELLAARDGYSNQSVRIFGADGTALALSHQTMLVFG